MCLKAQPKMVVMISCVVYDSLHDLAHEKGLCQKNKLCVYLANLALCNETLAKDTRLITATELPCLNTCLFVYACLFARPLAQEYHLQGWFQQCKERTTPVYFQDFWSFLWQCPSFGPGLLASMYAKIMSILCPLPCAIFYSVCSQQLWWQYFIACQQLMRQICLLKDWLSCFECVCCECMWRVVHAVVNTWFSHVCNLPFLNTFLPLSPPFSPLLPSTFSRMMPSQISMSEP